MGGTLKFFSSASGKLGTPGCSSQKLLSKGMDRGSYPTDLKVKCGDLPYKKDPSQWSQLTKDRVSKGLTEKELGERVGLTQSTVSLYELGKHGLGKNAIETLKKLAVAMGFSEDRYLDDYLLWIGGDPYAEFRELFEAHRGQGLWRLAKACGVTCMTLYSWRDGHGYPSRAAFELVKKRRG